MEEIRLILSNIQTTRRILKHLASQTSKWPALTDRLTDFHDSLYAADLSFRSWLQSHQLNDPRPTRYAQALFGGTGWETIASTLLDIKFNTQDISRGVDGIVARAVAIRGSPQVAQIRSDQFAGTDHYDQYLIEECLRTIRLSRSRSRTFNHAVLHDLNALEPEMDALYCFLTLLERLSDTYLSSHNPDLFTNIPHRLPGRSIPSRSTLGSGIRAPDSSSSRKDAELLFEACRNFEALTDFKLHLGLAIPGVKRRHFAFLLSSCSAADVSSPSHALANEALDPHPLTPTPTLHLHPVTLRSDPSALSHTLADTLDVLMPNLFYPHAEERETYLLPCPESNGTLGFRVTPWYATIAKSSLSDSFSSSASSCPVPSLQFWDPLAVSLQHQHQTQSQGKGKEKATQTSSTPLPSHQPLHPHTVLPLITTLIRSCTKLLGTPWLDALGCGSIHWWRCHPLSRNPDYTVTSQTPKSELHVTLSAPVFGSDGGNDGFVRRVVQRWRYELIERDEGPGGRERGLYWSDSEWKKRTHILALGILVSEIAIGKMVGSIKIGTEGDVVVLVTGEDGEEREFDSVKLAALVEARTNILVAGVVGSCLEGLKGEDGVEVGVWADVLEAVGLLEGWCEDGDEILESEGYAGKERGEGWERSGGTGVY
ncbi:hypothetical protein B0J11DRAFT_587065 [Dendryphion nanum]|uniref:Uncharacterized protein n=1 Tax=Dendryphion nanum TaxID=256645 RepID=A0A9P9EIE9_9PLEO|nr:hypothetical protein B0J11DRAFT_587065 [Dendryphion nanum]